MIRASWKSILIGALVVIAVSAVVSDANAGWWGRGGCGYYSCGYSGCYSGCYGDAVWAWGGYPSRGGGLVGRWGTYYGGCGCGSRCGWSSCGCGCSTCGWSPCGCGACTYDGCCGGGVATPVGATPSAPPAVPTPAPPPPTMPKSSAPPVPGDTAPPKLPGPGTPPAPVTPPAPESPFGAPLPGGTTSTPTLENSALLTVYVPEDANVTINGRATRSEGSKRQYVSYGLQPGLTYKYEVHATLLRDGQFVEDKKTIYLTAGKRGAVAFGSAPESTVAASR
jgi:uncharacterized protein (TIGR03000 family)